MNENPNPKPQKFEKANAKGCFILSVAAIVLFLLIKSCFSSEDEKPEVYKPTKQDAVALSHVHVEKQLKSPGSADFPYQDDESVEQLNDSTFIVYSYVDSQNGFGALLRTNYKCKIIISKDTTSRCEELVLE